ncbi:hypothetical protein FHX74_001290 [Friedmanniella endophytica]|uniref:Uncharacterized protein n=1 Tax=Microlunatus kandeliicorticis TaxID=1759536 RepID=A0A7W3IR61_9ACTN|nr:hypothetical protein [Microlunatus kandeliicorticis]MBA8793685.1 hypothetical protein [Microlunatus kandeliicorticis]
MTGTVPARSATPELRTVVCAQWRYTWAERRLDGRGAGFGVVVRSVDWPAGLEPGQADGTVTGARAGLDLADLLTHLSAAARRGPDEHAVPLVAHRRVGGGSLLVAKRAVGTDGAGRPGNYCVHALYDPTGTLGSLDLPALVDGGVFRLERDVDVDPDGEADAVRVAAPVRWRVEPAPEIDGDAGSDDATGPHGPWGSGPLRPDRYEDWPQLLAGLTRRLPADLVNRLEVDATDDREGGARPGAIDDAVARFADAVELGITDHDVWWQRLSRPVPDWEREAERFVMMTQPVSKVADGWLWARWDEATARGRTLVTNELLRRPRLAADADAVTELRRRRPLLDAMIDTAPRGTARTRTAAARWVGAAGDDQDVVDLAAALLPTDTGLPTQLRPRLQTLEPDRLPLPLARTVAEQLDGAEPMAAAWRRWCLSLHLARQPTCAHAEQLVRSSPDDELIAALRARPAGASVDTAWDQLADAVPTTRAAALFARSDPETAEALLRRPLDAAVTAPAGPGDTVGSAGPLRWIPQLARTLDWADWPAGLLLRLAGSEQALRRQRRALLIAVAVLLVAVVVLAVLLAVLPGPTAPR